MIPRPECHPECDETHALECAVPDWEASYWAAYFGLRPANEPGAREHNRRQLAAFAPLGVETGDES